MEEELANRIRQYVYTLNDFVLENENDLSMLAFGNTTMGVIEFNALARLMEILLDEMNKS